MILDAIGSERASFLGAEDGALTCSLFAATHPERVDRLIIYTLDPMGDQPWDDPSTPEEREIFFDDYLVRMERGWGTKEFAQLDPLGGLLTGAPALMHDRRTLDWYTAWQQLSRPAPVGQSPYIASISLRMLSRCRLRFVFQRCYCIA